MKEDYLLKEFFDISRWEYAIDKGVGKEIDKAVLYQLCKPEVRASMYQRIKTPLSIRSHETGLS